MFNRGIASPCWSVKDALPVVACMRNSTCASGASLRRLTDGGTRCQAPARSSGVASLLRLCLYVAASQSRSDIWDGSTRTVDRDDKRTICMYASCHGHAYVCNAMHSCTCVSEPHRLGVDGCGSCWQRLHRYLVGLLRH
eukprot:6198092-Pleurochrysis_carterae.AAC.1